MAVLPSANEQLSDTAFEKNTALADCVSVVTIERGEVGRGGRERERLSCLI